MKAAVDAEREFEVISVLVYGTSLCLNVQMHFFYPQRWF